MANFALLDTQAPGKIAGGYWDAADASQNALAKQQLMQNQNALAQIQMQQAGLEQRKFQRQMDDDTGQKEAYMAAAGNMSKLPDELLRRGQGKQAIEATKAQAEAMKLRTEGALKGLEYTQKAAAQVYVNPTIDTALKAIAQVEAATGLDMTSDKNMVMRMQNPQDIQKWADGVGSSINDLRAKIGTRDLGGKVQTTMTDPRTGQVTVTDATAKTATPGDLLTDSRGRAQLAQSAQQHRDTEARLSKQDGKPIVIDGMLYYPKDGRLVDPGVNAMKERTNAVNVLKNAGVDAATGADPVRGLIEKSTSGGLETFGAWVQGHRKGEATPGMEAIGKLESIGNSLVMDAMGGKLGAGISNSDVSFMQGAFAKIADPMIPANQRVAAWNEVVDRFAKKAGVDLNAIAAARSGQAGQMPKVLGIVDSKP